MTTTVSSPTGDVHLGTTAPARLVGLLLLGLGVLGLVVRDGLRDLEAQMVAFAVDLALRHPAEALGRGGLFVVDDGAPHLFRITGECAVAPIVAAVVILAGVLLALRGGSTLRFVRAAALACGLVLAVNLARILLIVFSWHRWGGDGYHVTHVYVGSAMVTLGVIAALWLFLRSVGTAQRGPR